MKKTLSVLLIGLLALTLVGSALAEAPITIQVGTMGTYSPFSYYDDDDNITGYDIEVLKLVEATDPSLHFEFTSGAWESLYPGLDSGIYDVLANQIVASDERREKYAFSEYAYFTSISQLIVGGDRDDINGLEDLEGLTVGLTVGDSWFNSNIEDYNAEHGDVINIDYYQDDITVILQDIVNGRIDATVNDPAVAVSKAAIQGLDVKPVGERLKAAPVNFVFRQDDESIAIRDRIDGVLAQLLSSGELARLSIDWFGADYTNPEN